MKARPSVEVDINISAVFVSRKIPVLEQRIGRVHRLGQIKPVRVINFVTSASIKERIIELLKFKRALFAGALDKDGQDTVLVGESQHKKFMQSVETMTDNIERPDPVADQQRRREDERADKADSMDTAASAVKTASAATGNEQGEKHDTLNDLLQSGARFLSSLGDMMAKPGEPMEKRLQKMIDRDVATGTAYLKIPLPKSESIKTVYYPFITRAGSGLQPEPQLTEIRERYGMILKCGVCFGRWSEKQCDRA